MTDEMVSAFQWLVENEARQIRELEKPTREEWIRFWNREIATILGTKNLYDCENIYRLKLAFNYLAQKRSNIEAVRAPAGPRVIEESWNDGVSEEEYLSIIGECDE